MLRLHVHTSNKIEKPQTIFVITRNTYNDLNVFFQNVFIVVITSFVLIDKKKGKETIVSRIRSIGILIFFYGFMFLLAIKAPTPSTVTTSNDSQAKTKKTNRI